MSNKEYNEFMKLYLRLKYLLKSYDNLLDYEEEDCPPIIIPNDVYNDICDALGKDEIGLMGIS